MLLICMGEKTTSEVGVTRSPKQNVAGTADLTAVFNSQNFVKQQSSSFSKLDLLLNSNPFSTHSFRSHSKILSATYNLIYIANMC